MIFATRKVKEKDEFSRTFSIIVTNLNGYVTDSEEFKNEFRVIKECQFEHDLYSKSFSNQLESDETDLLHQTIEWWMVVVDRGGPLFNDVYEYSFVKIFNLYRKATDPEMQGLLKYSGIDRLFHKKK